MTDLAQGPGWWQASDGKWYPPEQHPSHAVQTLTLPPRQSYSDLSQPNLATGKSKKPFWRRWWVIAIGAFILLMVAVSLAGSPEETATEPAAETPAQPAEDDDVDTGGDAGEAASDEPVAEAPEAPAPEEAAPESNLTPSQQNAVRAAESYLDFSGFSRQGLIDQLSSEFADQFPVEDATVAVDSLNVDWLAEALESAESYVDLSGFSRQGLIDQLSSEFGSQFTIEQAVFAADNVGADWNAEAVESAQSYLDFTGFSCQGLIDQLSSEFGSQFTIEQATYGATQTGIC